MISLTGLQAKRFNVSLRLSIRSLGWLTLINVLSAVIGLLQTVAIASVFGVTRVIEIYFAASTFIGFLEQLSGSGQISDLFTPIYHSVQCRYGRTAANNAFCAMINVMALIAMCFSLIAVIFAPQFAMFLVPGYSFDDQNTCQRVFIAVAPLFVFQVTASMFSGLLRAVHSYGVVESLSLFSSIINLTLILVVGKDLGVWALVFGMWVSTLVALLGQLAFAYRSGFRYRVAFFTETFTPLIVLQKIPFTLLHTSASQFFAYAVTASFSYLAPGPYAIYGYAKRLQSKGEGIVMRPIGLVFFNRFSQAYSEGTEKVRQYAEHALSLVLATVTICTSAVICSGDLILLGVWGGSLFNVNEIHILYQALIALTIWLLPASQYLVSRRTNLAMNVVATQFLASGLVLFACGMICFWVIPRYGVAGGIFMQYLSTVGTCMSTLYVLHKTNPRLVATYSSKKFLAWTASGMVAVFCVCKLRNCCYVDLGSRFSMISVGLSYGISGAFLTFIVSLLFRVEESQELVEKIFGNFKRIAGPSYNYFSKR